MASLLCGVAPPWYDMVSAVDCPRRRSEAVFYGRAFPGRVVPGRGVPSRTRGRTMEQMWLWGLGSVLFASFDLGCSSGDGSGIDVLGADGDEPAEPSDGDDGLPPGPGDEMDTESTDTESSDPESSESLLEFAID